MDFPGNRKERQPLGVAKVNNFCRYAFDIRTDVDNDTSTSTAKYFFYIRSKPLIPFTADTCQKYNFPAMEKGCRLYAFNEMNPFDLAIEAGFTGNELHFI